MFFVSIRHTIGAMKEIALIVALVALIVGALVTSGEWPIAAAAVLMALVVLMTVTVLVPINNRIGRWSSASDVSRDLARRWDRLHWLRVAMLSAMVVLLTVGAQALIPA